MLKIIDLSGLGVEQLGGRSRGLPLPLLMALLASTSRPSVEDEFPNMPSELPDNFKLHAFSCRACMDPGGFCLEGVRMLATSLLPEEVFKFDAVPVEFAGNDDQSELCRVYRLRWEGRSLVMVRTTKGNQLYEELDSVEGARIQRELTEHQDNYLAEMKRRYGPDAKPEQGGDGEEAAKAVASGA